MKVLLPAFLILFGFVGFVLADADVGVTQYDGQDPVALGSTISYAIVIMNSGPDPVANVVLTDTLPANVTFVSANTPEGWSCNAPQKDTVGSLNCTGNGLGAGENAAFTVVVKPSTAGVVTNTVTVASSEPDPNPENNSKSEETTVTAAAPQP